jgi:hypothetical protein
LGNLRRLDLPQRRHMIDEKDFGAGNEILVNTAARRIDECSTIRKHIARLPGLVHDDRR